MGEVIADDDFLEFVPPSGVASPCVNICRIDTASALCLGCGRTIAEIARWGSTDDDDRRAILRAIEARTAERHQAGCGAGISALSSSLPRR